MAGPFIVYLRVNNLWKCVIQIWWLYDKNGKKCRKKNSKDAFTRINFQNIVYTRKCVPLNNERDHYYEDENPTFSGRHFFGRFDNFWL